MLLVFFWGKLVLHLQLGLIESASVVQFTNTINIKPKSWSFPQTGFFLLSLNLNY
jgi:hypothetical protein